MKLEEACMLLLAVKKGSACDWNTGRWPPEAETQSLPTTVCRQPLAMRQLSEPRTGFSPEGAAQILAWEPRG